MNTFALWSDDALRDGVASGHISEWSALHELERRHPSPDKVPTPKDLFDHPVLHPAGFVR